MTIENLESAELFASFVQKNKLVDRENIMISVILYLYDEVLRLREVSNAIDKQDRTA